VRELLATVSSSELAEWEAFYAVEPFGPEQEEIRAGIIATLLANQWRKHPVKIGQLFPSLKRESRWDTPEGQVELARFLCATAGGTIIENKRG
jgi:hypothetical protein